MTIWSECKGGGGHESMLLMLIPDGNYNCHLESKRIWIETSNRSQDLVYCCSGPWNLQALFWGYEIDFSCGQKRL